jgi:hypothetical protein
MAKHPNITPSTEKKTFPARLISIGFSASEDNIRQGVDT